METQPPPKGPRQVLLAAPATDGTADHVLKVKVCNKRELGANRPLIAYRKSGYPEETGALFDATHYRVTTFYEAISQNLEYGNT